MNCSHFKYLFTPPRRENLWLLACIVAFFLIALIQSIALEGTSTLSGRVVDLEGNPVAGFGLSLLRFSVEQIDIISDLGPKENITLLESRTDEMGRFSMHNIAPAKVRLAWIARPNHKSGTRHEILSMKVGALIVYQWDPSNFSGIAFAIKPDTHVENVEIRVNLWQKIRGRTVFADGTPLTNASIDIIVRLRSLDGEDRGNTSLSHETDTDGYFIFHMDQAALYSIKVNYQGRSATAEPFLLRKGEIKEDLVFTFDSRPSSPAVSADRVEVAAETSTPSPPGDVDHELAWESAWVVNPANGHAYKRIRCKSWDDANTQAIAEDAYLVAINNAAEQEWISKTFQPHELYVLPHELWIGLTDYANEGDWVWASGEPVTFTNWAPFEPHDNDWDDEDFVLMQFSGKWSDVGPKVLEWRMPRMAIIERDSFTGKPTRTKRTPNRLTDR